MLSKECAQAEWGMPRCDKNLDPHSLFPPGSKPSAISDAKVRTVVLKKGIAPVSVTVVVPSLGTTRRRIARLYSRVSLAVCFSLHLSRPLTRELLGNVCLKNREQARFGKKLNQLVCVLRHCLLIPPLTPALAFASSTMPFHLRTR